MGLIQVSIPVGISAAAGWAMGGGCLGDETGGGRRGGLGGEGWGKANRPRAWGSSSWLHLLPTTYFLTTELLTELLTIHGHGHPLLRKSEPDRGHPNCPQFTTPPSTVTATRGWALVGCTGVLKAECRAGTRNETHG